VKSCVFLSSSQRGWCLLKSPNQIIWLSAKGRMLMILCSRKVDIVSWVFVQIQSLYMSNVVHCLKKGQGIAQLLHQGRGMVSVARS
jgi:hypothetical protein